MPPPRFNSGTFQQFVFDAAAFVGLGTVTWTVAAANVITWGAFVQGNLVTVFLRLAGTTTGGIADTQLQVTLPTLRSSDLPGGELVLTPAASIRVPIVAEPHALAAEIGHAIITVASLDIQLLRAASAGWPVGAADTGLDAVLQFPILQTP